MNIMLYLLIVCFLSVGENAYSQNVPASCDVLQDVQVSELALTETNSDGVSISPLITFIDQQNDFSIDASIEKSSKISAINRYAIQVGTFIVLKWICLHESVSTWWMHTKEWMRLKLNHGQS